MKAKSAAIYICCLAQVGSVYKDTSEVMQPKPIVPIYSSCFTAGDGIEIPQPIRQMTKKYPETEILIEYYKEFLKDPDYFSREIDISEDLATDDVPLFLQWDKRWAFLKYGKETIMATSGCAPACLSMALCYFKKDVSMHPKAIADFSLSNYYYTEHKGTFVSLFTNGASKFGLTSSTIEKNDIKMRKCFDEGKLIVALMGYGNFAQSGHFILIKGYHENGYFLINDPNSLINSQHAWAPETIINEAKQMWSLGI